MTLLGIAALLFGLAKLIEVLAPDDLARPSSSTPPSVAAVRSSTSGGELLRDDPGPLSESPSFALEHLAPPRLAARL